MRVAFEIAKSSAGMRQFAAQGMVEQPSEEDVKRVAIEYPIWAIVQLLEAGSGLPPGPTREAATNAATAAAEKCAAEEFAHVPASRSLEYVTDTVKVQTIVDRLTDAAVNGFVDSLRSHDAGADAQQPEDAPPADERGGASSP